MPACYQHILYFKWGGGSSCPADELSGVKLSGVELSGVELSIGRAVRGRVFRGRAARGLSCPRIELSMGQVVRGRVVLPPLEWGQLPPLSYIFLAPSLEKQNLIWYKTMFNYLKCPPILLQNIFCVEIWPILHSNKSRNSLLCEYFF